LPGGIFAEEKQITELNDTKSKKIFFVISDNQA
jgi:hypothetical protein